MKRTAVYIVDVATLDGRLPRDPFDVHEIPSDPTKRLVFVHWDNPNWEVEFENSDGVTWLGFPWDAPPADAVALLASLQPVDLTARPATSAAPSTPTTDAPAPTESLASLLRKTGLPVARLVR
jgi:hypothetical protein